MKLLNSYLFIPIAVPIKLSLGISTTTDIYNMKCIGQKCKGTQNFPKSHSDVCKNRRLKVALDQMSIFVFGW